MTNYSSELFIEVDGQVTRFGEVSASLHKGPTDHSELPISVVDELSGRLSELGKTLESVSEFFEATISKMPRLDEVTAEFGLKAGGKVGVPFVTEGTSEANFKITIKWKPRSDVTTK